LVRARARSLAFTASVLLVASCGSRTGLFGPLPDAIVDASVDAPTDASRDAADAARDVALDARLDALPDGPLACVPGTFDFALARPQLMFVLDRSGSMDFGLDRAGVPPPGAPTRWEALRDALSQTILPLSTEIAMGARFFPRANPNVFDITEACGQDPGQGIAPRLANAPAILDVFAQTRPRGGTPTSAALDLAAQQLSASRAVSRVMVLATDGAPNCNGALDGQTCTCTAADTASCRTGVDGEYNCLDDRATVATVTTIFGVRKIPVYVIGIGALGPFAPVLDAMAVAGGRPRAGSPRYLPADTPQELSSAFDVVKNSVARCTYITPSSPDDPDAISVTVDGQPIARDPTQVEGWDWIDKDFGHLQVFGAACAAASATNVSGEVSCRDK
jgi:hypothetical protein